MPSDLCGRSCIQNYNNDRILSSLVGADLIMDTRKGSGGQVIPIADTGRPTKKDLIIFRDRFSKRVDL